jgi:hypothetical protein
MFFAVVLFGSTSPRLPQDGVGRPQQPLLREERLNEKIGRWLCGAWEEEGWGLVAK